MAWKLSRLEHKRLDELIAELDRRETRLFESLGNTLTILKREEEYLNARIAEYNELVATAEAFVTEKAEEWRGDIEEKSESWREGDRGGEVEEFVSSWENFEAYPPEPVTIFPPEIDGLTDSDRVSRLLEDLERDV